MGVFSKSILAVFLVLPWRASSASGDFETRGLRAPGSLPPAVSLQELRREHNPSSAALRADLEAMRAFGRVR